MFGYAAMLVFANYFSLEVRSAVIPAPIENVKAQAGGRVQWTQFEPGDKVGAGNVVLRLFDNKVEREIDLARLAIKERGNELSYLMRRKVDELDKVAAFAQIETKQIAQARLRQENLQQQVETARLFYVRAEHLFQNGHTAATRVEETKRRLVDLEKKLESQKLELETRIKLAEKNIGKHHFTGRDMIGDLERVSAEVSRTEGLLELERQRYEIATRHRERLAVTAPFTGTLLRLARLNNGYVKAGETVALFEKSGERNITAFLTQDEVLDIALDARVDVYIPATGEIAAAQIVDINRTLGFFRQASRRSQDRLQWGQSKERTAQVILAFVKPERFARNPRYRAGLPVTVNFSRKSGSYFTAFARKQVQHALQMMPSGEALSDRARGLWDAYKAATNRFVDNVRAPRDGAAGGRGRLRETRASTAAEHALKGFAQDFRLTPGDTARLPGRAVNGATAPAQPTPMQRSAPLLSPVAEPRPRAWPVVDREL